MRASFPKAPTSTLSRQRPAASSYSKNKGRSFGSPALSRSILTFCAAKAVRATWPSICEKKCWESEMTKPSTADGYENKVTETCERVLVTLIRNLGPWRDSLFLVGGLTPRYLIDKKPPAVPPHAGTGDVDVVIQLHMLADNDAYHTLEENFKKMGFSRGTNRKGTSVSWRWVIEAAPEMNVTLELLADDPEKSGGKVMELPTEGNVSALNIPHSGIVFDHHKTKTIRAETLGDNGVAEVTLRYADLVAFTCLKAFAVDGRDERKDPHDLIYCLTHYEGG